MFTIQNAGGVTLCLLILQACSPVSNSYQNSAVQKNLDSKVALDSGILFRNEIPVRAVREVIRQFGTLENVQWQRTSRDGWMARYTTADANVRISFNASGEWDGMASNYFQTPSSFLTMIKHDFSGYAVVSCSAIMFRSDRKEMMFSVIIVKAGNCKVLKVYKGEMTVFSDFENTTTLTQQ